MYVEINWGDIRKEFESTDSSIADLAVKYDLKLPTIKSRKQRHGWAKIASPIQKGAFKSKNVHPAKDAAKMPILHEVEVIMNGDINHREKLFIINYIENKNATQAAIKAGYSEKTAHQTGYELLKKPEIRAIVEEALEAQLYSYGMNKYRLVQEYLRIGYFDPRKLFYEDGKPIPICDLDDDTAAALAGLDIQEVYEGFGEDRKFVGYTKKYKLSDKKGALDSVAKIMGVMVDKTEHTGKNGGPITVRFVSPNAPDQ